MNKLKIMIFNFMAKRKKSGLIPPTLQYCGHNAKKNRTKKIFVENLHAAYSDWPLIRSTISDNFIYFYIYVLYTYIFIFLYIFLNS